MSKKIKTIKTYTSLNPSNENRILSSIKEFDEKGNQILFQEFDDEESLTFEQKSSYDQDNKLIDEVNNNILDAYTETISSSYSEDGKLILEKVVNDTGWWYEKKYENDASNNTTTISVYDEEGELEERTIFKFNEKGKLISQVEMDENLAVKESVEYEYDENDLIISKSLYSDSKKPDRISNYFYDDNKNLVDIQVLNKKEKLIDWAKLAYNEKNELIEQISMSGTRQTIEYNTDSKTIIETSYNNIGEKLETQTTYKDSDENIIKEHFLSTSLVKEYEYEYF